MNLTFDSWLRAFALTQCIEVPIYLWFARGKPWSSRLLFAAGASAITHPLLWWALPWTVTSYATLAVAGESGVWLIEGLWAMLWRIPRPFLASLIANAASMGIGWLVSALQH